ncbi:MAG: nuclear transport factor 2 family protein [Oligoflexales bacterium]
MKASQFHQLIHKMGEAWTNRDYDFLESVFADDVDYYDPLRYRNRNLKELSAFFRNDPTDNESCVMHSTIFEEERQLGAAEYTYNGHQQYHGLVYIKIVNDKIAVWREYQHVNDKSWEDFIKGT